MASFLIGDVELITGIKAHVLRYWEEVIPAISPKKDIGGRRVYSSKDLEKILRLKYLIQEKKFTIEGARNQIIEEAGNSSNTDKGELIAMINETRGELLDVYLTIKKYKTGL